jgi:DNA-binding transcriptional regulator YbjK
MSERAREIACAAVEVLGEKGGAGLTHRAVDRHAGLPEGSTSNHFRTRGALIGAVCQFLTEHDLAQLGRASQGTSQAGSVSVEDAADRLAAIIETWTEQEAVFTAARLELFLIAHRDQDVAAQLAVVRRAFRKQTSEWLESLSPGAGAHALMVMAVVEGLTSNQLLHKEGRMPFQELRAELHTILDSLK